MTETVEASVIEPTNKLVLSSKPIVITSNLDALEAYVDNITEPFLSGEIDISTPELFKEAKDILAELNKAGEAIKRQRIDGFKEIVAPITAEEDRIKALEKKVESAYRQSKDVLDAKVASEQEERRKALEAEYVGIVGEDVARSVPYDKMANPKWPTKSFGEVKAQNELFERAEKIVGDIKILNGQSLSHPEKVMARFLDTLDLSLSLAYDKELTEQEEAEKRRAEEAAKAFKLHQNTPVQNETPAPVVEQSPDVELSDYTLVLKGISIFDAKDIARFAEQKTGKRPELRKG